MRTWRVLVFPADETEAIRYDDVEAGSEDEVRDLILGSWPIKRRIRAVAITETTEEGS